MKTVSVIVPVYNMEKYLQRCVDSLLRQTERDFELILVDDGSIDRSGTLCEQYATQDMRVKVLHQKNGGLSAARNAGIEAANGIYLAFIDSDDWVSPDYLAYLLMLLRKYDAAISVCGTLYTSQENPPLPQNEREDETFLFSREEALSQMFYQKKFDTSAWGKLYQAKLFETIRYPAGKWYEDLATTYKTFLLADKIAFGEKRNYFYFQRADGIMHCDFNEKRLEQLAIAHILYEEVSQRCLTAEPAALSRKASSYFQVLMQMPPQKTQYAPQKERIITFLRHNRTRLLKDKNTRLKNRIAFFLLPLGDRFLRMIYNHFVDNIGV